MPPRSAFPTSAEAPLRARLLAFWGLFMVLTVVGIGLAWWTLGTVPVVLTELGR
ncbi:MAG: hypothetical protein ACKVS7_12280 [Gemmatimonadaceae bacterium]